MSFAVYIPLGPGELEIDRISDLLDSLFCYEPTVTQIVIVSDNDDAGSICFHAGRRACPITILPHPRKGNKLNRAGGLCTANLIALNELGRTLNAIRFVVKLDTDSLIIAPFSRKVNSLLTSDPMIGTAGTLGTSCNRSIRSFYMDHLLSQGLAAALAVGLSAAPHNSEEQNLLRRWGIHTPTQLHSFQRICRMLSPIHNMSFSGQHCQGGAYMISRRLVWRLSAIGFLETSTDWLDLTIGEDQMMGALCTLAGLKVVDYSCVGEVFGVQACGLPYSPSELITSGFSIIHSVKSDDQYSEQSVRKYFQGIRHTRI